MSSRDTPSPYPPLYPEPFDAARALADLQAAGVVVTANGFQFPAADGDPAPHDAFARLGSVERQDAVLELVRCRRRP